jgi:hypothetical protein
MSDSPLDIQMIYMIYGLFRMAFLFDKPEFSDYSEFAETQLPTPIKKEKSFGFARAGEVQLHIVLIILYKKNSLKMSWQVVREKDKRGRVR